MNFAKTKTTVASIISMVALCGILLSTSWAQEKQASDFVSKANAQIGESSDGVVRLQGVIDPIATLRLATRDAGIVKEVRVSEGTQVKAGDVIAVLDTEMYESEVAAAEDELKIASEETKNDVDLQYAKISTEVNQKVFDRSSRAANQFAKSVSKTELEKLKLEFERSRLSGLQAERQQDIQRLNESLKRNQLKIASTRLKNRTVRSEISGTVVEVFHTPGEFVNSGQPIARILNLNQLRVICLGSMKLVSPDAVPKTAVLKIRQQNGEALEFPATISFVSPEIDPVRQTFAIWAEVKNVDGKLKSGMIGELVFAIK